MNAYFDSGVLLKNYCEEPNSNDAIALILAEPAPLPFTLLQEAEIRNTFRLKVFRKEITLFNLPASTRLLEEDIHEHRLERVSMDWPKIYRRAEMLSEAHTISTGARLLDILHVAVAIEIGSTRFYSFDQRQRAIAKKAGLTVLPR